MAKLFGLPGSDDASNRRFAANLMKYQGWKSVAYKGRGIYDVVYHYEGRLGQDYAFPMMPDSDLMIPFVMLRNRTDGSVQVSAPAFVGGQGVFGARAAMQGLPGSKDVHCEQAWRSVPQRKQRVSLPMSGETGLPHWEQRTSSRNPGMLMLRGPSWEMRRAPAGAPGSTGFRAAGFGARSRSSS